MVIEDPCGICKKAVAINHRAIQCDVCKFWVHIKCNNVTPPKYEEYMDDDDPWLCINCIKASLPFGELDNKLFYLNQQGISTQSNLEKMNFTINPTDKNLIKQITNLIIENTDPEHGNNKFCNYYDVDKFVKKKFKPDSNFSLLHLNIASLQFHFDDLKILLQVLDFPFDIIAISETKIQKGIDPLKDINLPNYQYLHTPTETTKGGTLIYISNKLIFKPRPDLEIYQAKDIESTFTEIIMPKGKNIIVGCIYKHHTIDQIEFAKQLIPLLEKTNKEKKPVFITGDFNIDLLKINQDKNINKYFDSLTDNNFMPLITLPTRITSSTKTLIDNILHNQFTPNIQSGNLSVSISDHIPQFAIIPITNKNFLPKNHNIFIRDYKNVNKTQLINSFQSVDWEFTKPNDNINNETHININDLVGQTNINNVLNNEPPNRSEHNESNVNDDISKFFQLSNEIIDNLAPLRKITNKEYKLKSKPWITNGILKSIKVRDSIYRRLMKAKNQIRKENLQHRLRHYKNKIKNLIRSSKHNYFKKYFADNNKNAKKLWEGINEIISSKTKTKTTINCLEIKNDDETTTTITDPKEIANTAVNYFTNVADEILNKRKYNGNTLFTDYLKSMNNNPFSTTPTTQKEIETIIESFDSSKSVGPNSIPPKILKVIAPQISLPISNICNKSFKTGIFPDQLKISKINPIHKKDSKLKISNYRPISLLSNINKIIEKLMFTRLQNFLETNNCIYKLQFGFRAKHSTNHAILSITQKIQEAINNDKLAIGIFIDLQKAFDTVNHSILLEKLNHYGVKGIANKWFESYLNNRKHFVTINGINSDKTDIKHGVPQGSVLGPLLFLIYINDLHQCIKDSNTFHFSDDTNILYTPNKNERNINPVRRLNTDLKALNQWLIANKISLNASKTEMIYFRKKNTEIPELNIKLNGIKLSPKSQINYLGLTFDEHLTFKPHTNLMNAKLKRANNLLAISRHYLPQNLLKHIYYSQFHSHISYGCQVWGSKLNSISQTFILQKKAIRLISFANKDAHTDPLFKNLEIIKLQDIITSINVLFVHKTLNGDSPTYFNNFFQKYKPNHNYNTTRNPNSTFSIPPGSVLTTNITENTFKMKCAQDWNKILKSLTKPHHPNEWLLENKIHKLKTLMKYYFLDSYY